MSSYGRFREIHQMDFCIYEQRVIIVHTPTPVAQDYDSFKFYIPDKQNSDANEKVLNIGKTVLRGKQKNKIWAILLWSFVTKIISAAPVLIQRKIDSYFVGYILQVIYKAIAGFSRHP